MPDPSSQGTRAAASLLVLLMLFSAAAPVASALDTSNKAIRVAGSSTYNPETVQAYAGTSDEGLEDLDGAGVAIAVLDTGVDNDHPTFQGARVHGAELMAVCDEGDCFRDTDANGNPGYDPDDRNGHGTHVASIALGRGAPSQGGGPATPMGVAPGAHLVDVKIANDLGSATTDDIAKGIEWIIDYNAGETPYGLPLYPVRVISLSLGSLAPKDGEDAKDRDAAMTAIRKAFNAGILTVAAAGNCGPGDDSSVSIGCSSDEEDGSNTITSPGAAPEALTVGAVDDQGTVTRNGDAVAGYSSRGPNPGNSSADTFWRKPDVVAPGSSIQAACHSNLDQSGRTSQLCTKSGTSMATPHAAGLAAILFQVGRAVKPSGGYSPDEVKKLVTSTAEEMGPVGWDPVSGHGYIDGYGAVVKALNDAPEARFTASPLSPAAGEQVLLDASLTEDPDEQDTIERLIWDLDDGSDPIEVGGEERILEHVFDEPGTYAVKLTAVDSRGATDVARVSVDVKPPPPPDQGQAPDAELTWTPKKPRLGETIQLDASGSSDPDGDALVRYEWDLDHVEGDFRRDDWTQRSTYNWTPQTAGAHQAAVRVIDERGLSSIVVRGVAVLPPPPGAPDVSFTNPQEGDRIQPGPLLASWTVAENPASNFTLFVDGHEDQLLKGHKVRLDLAEGDHTLRLIARGPGGTSVSWVNFTATDQPLEANEHSASGCQEHTHKDGTTETHCGGSESCQRHTHSDGTTEEHCPNGTSRLPTGRVTPTASGSDEQDEAPLPPFLALLAALGAALARRRQDP